MFGFFCLFLSFPSRGANFLTQVLLRPGASDLTGSFRWGKMLMTSLWQFYWPTQLNFRIRAPSAGGVKQLQLLNRWVLQENLCRTGVDNLSGFSCLWLSPVCQTVQEEGAGESGGALRLQRLRLPDGDDRPRQTAQLHRRRSEGRDSIFFHRPVVHCIVRRALCVLHSCLREKKKKRKQALPVGRGLLCFRPASDGNPLLLWTLKPREVQSGFVCVCASKRFLLHACLSSDRFQFPSWTECTESPSWEGTRLCRLWKDCSPCLPPHESITPWNRLLSIFRLAIPVGGGNKNPPPRSSDSD